MAVVGEPLAPNNLEEMGALKGWPPPAGKFAPQGNWAHTYRIWTCHGYTDRGNDNRGVLQIKRRKGPISKTLLLNIVQKVVHTGDLVHRIDAEAPCSADDLASPGRWSLRSRYFDPEGNEREDLALVKHEEEGKKPGRRTSDWCLFEAIQRHPFGGLAFPPFELLEGFTVRRPGQSIAYRGMETFDRKSDSLKLHRFHQIGHGTLPYEYWVDEDHRLLLICSLDKAFILDPDAESKVRWRSKSPARKAVSK